MTDQRYRVVRRLDAGGMAEVFVGMATSIKGFDKTVAIKRVLPNLTRNRKFVRMFLDEARLSLLLNHTNVVQVFDVGQADGTYFIVMEFIDGVNLKALLEAADQWGGRVGVPQAVLIASEVCKGLSYAHDLRDPTGQPLGIVHRDISPPNVLISEQGEVKIADFGLAKARSQVEHTDPGFVKGKFGYLSPEAAYGEPIDPRTDIFAVGIVLWEMLAGRRLFQGQTDLKTLDLVRKARIPELTLFNPDVPPDLETIVYKALARDKSARYQRSDELGNDLMQFLFDHGLKVASFDIAELVKKAKAGKSAPVSPRPLHEGLEEMIQQEISHFISATTLEQAAQATLGATSLEDPAQWFDFAEDPTAAASGGRSRLINIQAVGPAAQARADHDDAPPDINLDSAVAAPGMFKDEDAAGDAVDVDFETSESAAPDAQSKQAHTQTHTPSPTPTPTPAPTPAPDAPSHAHPDDGHPDDVAAAADADANATHVMTLEELQNTGKAAGAVPSGGGARKVKHNDTDGAGWEGEATRIIRPSEQQQQPAAKPPRALLGAVVVLLVVLIVVVIVVSL